MRSEDGSPPYFVRWLDDGRETLVFPGPDAQILTADEVRKRDRAEADLALRVQSILIPARVTAATRVDESQARDVAVAGCDRLFDWWAVDQFVRSLTPAQAGHVAFPVVGADGRAEGVISWRNLERVPRANRATTLIKQAASAGPGLFAVQADAPLSDVILPLRLRGGAAWLSSLHPVWSHDHHVCSTSAGVVGTFGPHQSVPRKAF